MVKSEYIPHNLEMFVDLSQPYEKIKFIQANFDKDDPNVIWGAFIADGIPGQPPTFDKKLLSEFTGPFFPSFSKYKHPRKEILNFYRLYLAIAKRVDSFLIDQPGYRTNVRELEDFIVKENFTLDQVKAVLKALLANPVEYLFKRTGNVGCFYFATEKAKYQSQFLYYKSIAEELRIKSNKISLLVSHGQTVGNYREDILRDLIKQHLPEKFAIATGFIQGFANQLDILIYDAHNYAPLFKEGDLVVVKQEAVRAIIEVKTTLSSSTLFQSLEMFKKISLPGYRSTKLPIFKGIYSFTSKYRSTSAVAKSIYDYHYKPYIHPDLQKLWTNDILYLFHQITCVATLNKHCVFSKYNYANDNKTSNLIPYLYSVDDEKDMDIQTAMFLSLLFEYLDVEPYAKKASVWNINKQLNNFSTIKMERKLAEDDWFPRSRGEHEHNGEQDSIKHRINSYEAWFSGDISTEYILKDQSEPND